MRMFTEEAFQVFSIEGLDNRMQAIRTVIQPTFKELDQYFSEQLKTSYGLDFVVHIAQHRRRTTHPPENTWSALSRKKRGYKMEAHLQLGIWPEYVFMWLSLIDNPKNEKETAQLFLAQPELFDALSDDFYVSLDHTKPVIDSLSTIDLKKALTRFKDVKKGEFQVGRIIRKEDPLLNTPEDARAYMLDTFKQLVPLYQTAITAE